MTDQQTTDRLNDALDFLLRSMQETKDFTMEQAPLVAKEIVAWEFWGGVSNAVIGVLLVLTSVIVIKTVYRRTAQAWSGDSDDMVSAVGGVIVMIVCILVVCGSSVQSVNGTTSAIKASVAPRLVVLDYVRGAIK